MNNWNNNKEIPLTPGNVCFSCNALWAVAALSGLKYVKKAQPISFGCMVWIHTGESDWEMHRWNGKEMKREENVVD